MSIIFPCGMEHRHSSAFVSAARHAQDRHEGDGMRRAAALSTGLGIGPASLGDAYGAPRRLPDDAERRPGQSHVLRPFDEHRWSDGLTCFPPTSRRRHKEKPAPDESGTGVQQQSAGWRKFDDQNHPRSE